ncbi:MAG: cytochrome c-type biogenesis protein CcmH [Methylococcales bacterium]
MRFLKFLILIFISSNSFAAIEYHKFVQPEQEATYKLLTKELRCLVCQNQTIADSNADLAKDLRRQVYEMLQQGKSKDQIIEFMTQRYGDFVLYNPPFKAKTGLLWIGPFAFLLIGLIMLIWVSRRRKNQHNELTENELQKKARIKSLLSDEAEQ